MNTIMRAAIRRQEILRALEDGPCSIWMLARRMGSPRQSVENNVALLIRQNKIQRSVVSRCARRIAVYGLPGFDPDEAETGDPCAGSDRPIFAEIVRARFASLPPEEHTADILRHLVKCWGSVSV